MTTVTGLVAEDEAPQRERLCKLLAWAWPELDLVAVCADGDSARQAAQDKRPQVAFLDIRMPGTSGIEVARELAGQGALVVFTTAWDEYAIEAFDANAVDYLLKPVDEARLALSVERLRRRLAEPPQPMEAVLDALAKRIDAPERSPLQWIPATVGDSVRMVNVNDVLFFQASEKYVRVVTADGEVAIRTPIKTLAEQLDGEAFWQVHRGTIVRVAAIQRLTRDELGHHHLQLRGSRERLPVSSRFLSRFRGM